MSVHGGVNTNIKASLNVLLEKVIVGCQGTKRLVNEYRVALKIVYSELDLCFFSVKILQLQLFTIYSHHWGGRSNWFISEFADCMQISGKVNLEEYAKSCVDKWARGEILDIVVQNSESLVLEKRTLHNPVSILSRVNLINNHLQMKLYQSPKMC